MKTRQDQQLSKAEKRVFTSKHTACSGHETLYLPLCNCHYSLCHPNAPFSLFSCASLVHLILE